MQASPPEPGPVPPAQPGGSARPSHRWRMLLIGAIVLALLVLAWLLLRRPSDAEKQYMTVAADTGTVAPSVIASGTVNPVTTIQVGTYVSGVIKALTCDFNTRVHAGQLCAKIDARPYQTTVDQEMANLATVRAQLQKDQANLAFSKLIYERDADLLRRNIVSQETVDTAKNAYAQARSQITLDEANIQQRQAILNAARINLGYTDIVSPVDGTVVSRNVTQGQTVAASFQTPTLFLIATDLTKMQVDTNVSESDIGRIALGNAASFTVEAFPERRFEGDVTQVRQAPQTVQNVITYDVVVSVDNPELLLKPGMTASARIVTQRRDNVLRVPAAALRYVPSGSASRSARAPTKPGATPSRDATSGERPAQVWLLRDGRPQRVPILAGLDDDTYVEVRQGAVHAGDAVIVSERSGGARAPADNAQTGPRLPRL